MTTSALAADRAAALDQALTELRAGEKAWAACGLARRKELLDQVHAATASHADGWVRAGAAYKKLDAASPLRGEEWMSGPYPVLLATATLAQTAAALQAGRSPVDDYPLGTGPGGRVTVKILPHTAFDKLLLTGFSAEVWMPPGVTAEMVREQAGLGLRDPEKTDGIGLVLGAGNITSIPVLDVLYELFASNRVTLLKLNPLTDGMLPVYEQALKPLIDLGVVRIVTGAGDVGGYLVNHELVGHVHMTGSSLTHDAIVFGTGDEGQQRKRAGTPVLDKPITSELGGVSPVIVLPGQWSQADLKYQAEHVATQRLHNGGYNCIASQAVIVSSDWPQKDAFLARLRAAFAAAPARPAYYPGSEDRVARAVAAYPGAEVAGGRVLVTSDGGPLLTDEYFAPVLGVLELPGNPRQFLDAAVEAANERFTGTLGANIIAHPKTITTLGPAFDMAIAGLRYGTVAVNAWTALGYLTAAAPWGAFPGHTLADVQSGIGVVHNALLLAGPERTVVRGPFRSVPKPPWFVTNKTAAITGRRLVSFAASPRWSALPGIFWSAMRG
jgi:aldehyde dehydrogenase (NAD(P)+)